MERYLLTTFDSRVARKSHENAVNKDRGNDKEAEDRMDQNINCHSTDWIERAQQVQGVGRTKPKDIFPFTNHHERLGKEKEGMMRELNSLYEISPVNGIH